MSKGFFQNAFDLTGVGLLRKPLKEATGLTDAQLLGLGAIALTGGAAAPAVFGAEAAGAGAAGASTAATTAAATDAAAAGGSGGLLSTMGTYGKPALQGLQGAQIAQQMSQGHQTPMQPGQLPQFQQVGVLGGGADLQAMQQKRMARRGVLGGA